MPESKKAASVGKWLLTLGTAIYTFIPPVVDILTPTHIFHPDWPAHARFHTMWAIIAASTMGIIALWLIWRSSPNLQDSVKIAGLISSGLLGAFMVAAVAMPSYGGALADANGMPGLPVGIDLNLLTFGAALIMVLGGWRLAAGEG